MASRWGALAFCSLHLSLLLIHNLQGNTPSLASRYCTLTATSQSWGMFAPYAGSTSTLPVLALTWQDGRVTLVHSEAAPPFPALEGRLEAARLDALAGEQPVHGWRPPLGDARRRAVSMRAALELAGAAGVTPLRQALARQWLLRTLRDPPAQKEGLRRADLYRWSLDHPGDGQPGHLVATAWLMEYDPWSDPLWPEERPLGARP